MQDRILSAEELANIRRRVDPFVVGDLCRDCNGVPPRELRAALCLPADAHPSDEIGLLCDVIGELSETLSAYLQSVGESEA